MPVGVMNMSEHATVSRSTQDEEFDTSKSIGLRVIGRHLLSDIDTKRTDIVLIVCAFVSGLVDGTSFNAWGSFSSMQTG